MCIHAHQPKCAHVCCMDAGAPIAWTDAPTGRYQVLSQSSDHSGYTTRNLDKIRVDSSAQPVCGTGLETRCVGKRGSASGIMGAFFGGVCNEHYAKCKRGVPNAAPVCCAVCCISSFVPEDISSSPYGCRRWAICVHSGKEIWSGL